MFERVKYLFYLMIRVLMVISIINFLINKEWFLAFATLVIFGLIMIPRVLKIKYKVVLPYDFEIATVVFIYLSIYLGSLRNYYERFSYWDTILHFQSGILLWIIGFFLVFILNVQEWTRLRLSAGFVSFFAVTFSVSMWVIWEIYEFIMDTFFHFNMQKSGIPDTMEDLIINALGAIIVAIIGYVWMKNNRKIPFSHLFTDRN